MKYVHPFIFSLCTLIPMNPLDVLSRGSGTLCESLLIAESKEVGIMIPVKRIGDEVYYNGHLCDNISYVCGHVECLKSGIYRSDFTYEYKIKKETIKMIEEIIPSVLLNYKSEDDYEEIENKIKDDLRNLLIDNKVVNDNKEDSYSKIETRPKIYHLDVAAMYPNIILTNRLQPISVINQDTCVKCDISQKIIHVKEK